jgi:glycosyltransferase domain-containing protein
MTSSTQEQVGVRPLSQDKTHDVTILLTLKGREIFTLRWMWHANRIRLPFHILIADGEVRPALSRVLKNKSLFPNLSYEYHEYNDSSYLEFYKKFADAVRKIPTRYMKTSDNDDFVCPYGLSRDVEFLEANPDFIAAQGGIAGFNLKSGEGALHLVSGDISRFSARYNRNYLSRSFDEPTGLERVISSARRYHPIYYCVYDKNRLQVVLDEIVAHNFQDLQIHELYWAFRVLSLGKVRSTGEHLSYIRQHQTSSHPPVDFAHRLVNESFIDDSRQMVQLMANHLAGGSEAQVSKVASLLNEAFVIFLRDWIFNNYRNRQEILFRFALVVKRGLELLQRPFRVTRFFRRQVRMGIQPQALEALRCELSEVHGSLMAQEFIDFVSANAPEYLGGVKR